MSIKTLQRALQLKELGRHQDALPLLEDLIQDEDYAPNAWEEIADCHIELEDLNKAEMAIRNAINLEPVLTHPRSTLAYIKHLQGNTRRARILLQHILSEDPTDFRARYLLAQVYLSTRNFDKALRLVQSLENDLPDNPELRTLRIRYHALKNDKASFNHEIDAYLHDDPEDTYTLSLKALSYLDDHQFEKAEEVAMQVLSINPMDTSAKEVLLSCRQNSNALLRFFVGKSFNLYVMEWTIGRVILAILCFKGVLLWGGFFIAYMLITWMGGVLYNSYLRINFRDRLLLTPRQINQSNFLLINLGVFFLFRVIARFSEYLIYDKISVLLIPIMFIGISYFQLESRNKKIYFAISTLLMSVVLYLGFSGADLFGSIAAAITVVILHGVLFTFRAIGE